MPGRIVYSFPDGFFRAEEAYHLVFGPEKALCLESEFSQQEGTVKRDDSNRDALQNLNKNLAQWAKNADTVVPGKTASSKGVMMDNNGYGIERRAGEPMMVEVSLRHSR